MIDKQPIYEHVGDTSWQFNLIGDSAMALTALRNAGLPENDLVIYKMSENLLNYLDTYGAPDHTWNVAQLAIALARTPGEVAQEWTLKLASRLLDGQISDGPARGLWGPMCIHPRILAVVIRDYLAGEAEVEKLKAKLKERPTKANEVLLSAAEGGRNRLKTYAETWSRSALRFATVEWPLVWEDLLSEKVQFGGATEFFYNQRAADMESTWGARFKRVYRTSSMRERWAAMSEMPGRLWRDWRVNQPVDINKAHVACWNHAGSEYTVSPGTPFATAIAVNYLASRLKDPGAMVYKLIDDPKLADQRKGIEAILLPPPKPKAPPPPPKPIAQVTPKPAEPKKAEMVVPKLEVKPKDATPKKDESF